MQFAKNMTTKAKTYPQMTITKPCKCGAIVRLNLTVDVDPTIAAALAHSVKYLTCAECAAVKLPASKPAHAKREVRSPMADP
jgi:hypothetical protein